MRQAKANRRGLGRGVQRHVIRNRHQDEDGLNSNVSPSKSREWLNLKLERAARFCFEKTFLTCSVLYLIQVMVQSEDCKVRKTYKYAPIWRRRVHVLVLLLLGASIALTIKVTWRRLEAAGMDATSAVCLCGSAILLGAALVGLGTLLQPAEMVQLLNSWSSVLRLHTNQDSVWSDPIVCIQVILISTAQNLFPLFFPLLGLVMREVPIFLLPSLQHAGILSTNSMIPDWIWWTLLYPVEVLMYGCPVFIFCLTGQIMVVEVGIFRNITREIR